MFNIAKKSPLLTGSVHCVNSQNMSSEGCECLKILQNHPLYPAAVELTQWTDPVRSGLFFAILNITMALLTYGEYTVLSLFFSVVFYMISGSLVYTLFMRQFKKVNDPMGDRFKDSDFTISQQFFQDHANTVYRLIEDCRKYLKDVCYGKNYWNTLKAVISFFFISLFSDFIFCSCTLWFALDVAFVFPKVYSMQQKKFDDLYLLAQDKATTTFNQAWEKTPPVVKGFIEKLKQE